MNVTNRIIFWTAALLSLIATASAQPPNNPTSAKTGAYKIQETHLVPIVGKVCNLVLNDDGRHFAYATTKGGKKCVVVDGQAGPEYDCMASVKKFVLLSHDGKRAAYIGMNGMKQFVVADGKAGPEYEGVGPPYFSVDGKRLAYGATKGPCEKLVVVDGKEGAVYFMILGGNWFSPDGKRVAYMAFKNDFKKSVVVVDGREVGAEYEKVGLPVFSPDGNRLAFSAHKGTKHFVVVDGQAGTEYEEVGLPVFSPDGKHLAYGAKKGKKQFVVVDAQAGRGV